MEFRNLTPFDALCYGALDPDNDEHQVVVMKVGYRLTPGTDPGTCLAQVMDVDPVPLTLADEFHGEPGLSSVREESDLAPYKPKCDVLVRGTARAPGNQDARGWTVRVRVSAPAARPPATPPERPRPLNPMMGLTEGQRKAWSRLQAEAATASVAEHAWYRTLLDKSLEVSGPSEFRRSWWTLGRRWTRTAAQPVTEVPLQWELAYGGSSRVLDPGAAADAPPLLNEVCFSNPLGRGWREARYVKMCRRARLPVAQRVPAPQLEYPGQRMRAPDIAKHRPAN